MSILLNLTALGLTAITLIPSGAHFFQLPRKIVLERDAYFIVQGIYEGWAWFVIPIVGAILANIAVFVVERRRDRNAAGYALLAAALIVGSLAVFFTWILPGNQATSNWTMMVANWQELRRNWEYGHAANAVILFVALLSIGRALIGCRVR